MDSRRFMAWLGFVPTAELDETLTELSQQRIANRALANTADAQEIAIERMAGRYADTVDAWAMAVDAMRAKSFEVAP